MNTELFVELVVPDTHALTTLDALRRGGVPLTRVVRRQYYSFDADQDLFSQLSKIDMLVNVNKHRCFSCNIIPQDGLRYAGVLVTDKEESRLGEFLQKNFGITVAKARTGTLWLLGFEQGVQTDPKVKLVIESLLHNKHYQEVRWV